MSKNRKQWVEVEYPGFEMASKEEAEKYFETVDVWFATTVMWNDAKYCARTAVAEFLANKDGKTVYECMTKPHTRMIKQ